MSLTKVTSKNTTTISSGWDLFNALIDDLLAVTANKGASQVGVQDSADNFTGINVETILAEIQATVDALSTTFTDLGEDSDTTTGLTWGYKAGIIQFNNAITSVDAGTLGLEDDDTNYVEVNSSGEVVKNTSAFNSGSIPLRLIVCSGGVQTSTDKRSWLVGTTLPETPLSVASGGTGAVTFTDHGILFGSGTSAITASAAMTDGKLLIGKTGSDPSLATLTATANETSVTTGAGTVTIGLADDIVVPESITVKNSGLHILDTDASHDLIIKPGSDLTADRILTIVTGDVARTLTLEGNQTLPASGTLMTGDGGTTQAYFYLNTAPTGWTIDNTVEDCLLAVKGGSQLYDNDGGTQNGSWTQPDHTLEPTEIPAHAHAGAVQSAGSGGSFSRYVGSQDEGAAVISCYYSSGSIGGGEPHNHGTTYRPYACLGIICTLDA